MKATVVVDLGFGDSGKGALVDRLCLRDKVGLVVRYNGGCQAAHNVVMNDGRIHTFAQWGSGTLRGVPTHLSKYVMVDPLALRPECEHLAQQGVLNPWRLLTIDPDCLVTTPWHRAANRCAEDTRAQRHGSTGRGIGMTMMFAERFPKQALRMRHFYDGTGQRRMQALDVWLRSSYPTAQFPSWDATLKGYADVLPWLQVSDAPAFDGDLVFEGAQGVLLDEWYGFHPHTTWSTTTPHNARELLDSGFRGIDTTVLGVVRTYTTRHGEGPMPSEDRSLDLPEKHNTTTYAGAWRVGHFDFSCLRYAVDVCDRAGGIDALYVTHADALDFEPRLRVASLERPIEILSPTDFPARREQTQWLSATKAVDTKIKPTPGNISRLLQLPLAGIGTGPNSSAGQWFS